MSSDPGSSPITANSILKFLPLVLVFISMVAWGSRLESKIQDHEERINEVKNNLSTETLASAILKNENIKLNGQIETLKVMLQNVAETTKRIEEKIDHK